MCCIPCVKFHLWYVIRVFSVDVCCPGSYYTLGFFFPLSYDKTSISVLFPFDEIMIPILHDASSLHYILPCFVLPL